jgi:hypothetical protein
MRLLVTLVILVIAQTALAQASRRECPGLKAGAREAQQALCWFEKEQKGAAECAVDKAGDSACRQQAALWCAGALLDDAPVANACFLANLRAGQLEEALALKRYLQSPTAEVIRCGQALQSITVKFVSVPTGAELMIDGRSYGKTPVEVELRDHWWRSAAVARFGSGESTTEVEISRKELMDAFNRLSCTMAEVAVTGPESAPTPSVQSPQPLSSEALTEETPDDERAGVSIPGVISMAVGGAGIITGGVLLAIALSRKSEVSNPDDDTQFSPDIQDKGDSVKPLSIGGFTALGVGAALATVGIVLIATSGGSSTEEAPGSSANGTLRLTGQGIQLTGTF